MNATLPVRQPVTEEVIIRLAKEMAAELKSIEQILQEFGLDAGDFEQIKLNDKFQVYLLNARIGWGAAENIEDRVKKKAAAALEECLPEFYARIHDPKETLTAKVAAGDLLRKVGSIGNAKVEGGAEKFSLVINIGSATKTVEGQTINVTDYSKVEQAT